MFRGTVGQAGLSEACAVKLSAWRRPPQLVSRVHVHTWACMHELILSGAQASAEQETEEAAAAAAATPAVSRPAKPPPPHPPPRLPPPVKAPPPAGKPTGKPVEETPAQKAARATIAQARQNAHWARDLQERAAAAGGKAKASAPNPQEDPEGSVLLQQPRTPSEEPPTAAATAAANPAKAPEAAPAKNTQSGAGGMIRAAAVAPATRATPPQAQQAAAAAGKAVKTPCKVQAPPLEPKSRPLRSPRSPPKGGPPQAPSKSGAAGPKTWGKPTIVAKVEEEPEQTAACAAVASGAAAAPLAPKEQDTFDYGVTDAGMGPYSAMQVEPAGAACGPRPPDHPPPPHVLRDVKEETQAGPPVKMEPAGGLLPVKEEPPDEDRPRRGRIRLIQPADDRDVPRQPSTSEPRAWLRRQVRRLSAHAPKTAAQARVRNHGDAAAAARPSMRGSVLQVRPQQAAGERTLQRVGRAAGASRASSAARPSTAFRCRPVEHSQRPASSSGAAGEAFQRGREAQPYEHRQGKRSRGDEEDLWVVGLGEGTSYICLSKAMIGACQRHWSKCIHWVVGFVPCVRICLGQDERANPDKKEKRKRRRRH